MTCLLLLLAGCAWESDAAGLAPDIGSEPVAAAVGATQVVASEETERLQEELIEARRQIEALDDRLSRVELLIAEMAEVGIGQADRIRYDPARSELDGRSVQEALDELAEELKAFQSEDPMGDASHSLFQMHEDNGPMGGASLAPRTGDKQPRGGQGRQGGDPQAKGKQGDGRGRPQGQDPGQGGNPQ